MRAPVPFAICLSFSLICANDSDAQRRRAPPASRARAAAVRPAPRVAWTITEQPYNEDGQSTTLVSLHPMPLGLDPGARHALSFGINFSYEGKSSADFKHVALNLFSRSAGCRLPPRAGLVLAHDGQTLTLAYQPDVKGVDGVWSVSGEAEGGTCNETLIAHISPATLAKLAAAKKLTGRVGEDSFQFTSANLGALRDFVSRLRMPQLTPPTARPLSRR